MKKVVLIMMLAGIALISCKKDKEVEGCVSAEATNYNPDATVDDGSCVYPAPIVEEEYNILFVALDEDGIDYFTNINVEINGVIIGNLSDFTTSKNDEEFYYYWLNNGETFETGLTKDIIIGTNYEVILKDASNGEWIYKIEGEINLGPNTDFDENTPWFASSSTFSFNEVYVNIIANNGYDVEQMSFPNTLVIYVYFES